ncbi:MAG TPA: phosphoadenylyl-sulfate reductase [Acidimicrobiales bacterium]|nr:phosphoadenylyl-sulfate reductase [Acidimicrobiales bacterium]
MVGDESSSTEYQRLAAHFEAASAEDVVAWTMERFGRRLSLVSSFQNCVLVDLVTRVDPKVDIIFLDTGAHFPETMTYVERVETQYQLKVRVITPDADADAWPCGSERCCEFRKTKPLERALEGQEAWMSGIKRVDSETRRATPIVDWDESKGLVKVNPIATWSHDDVSHYEADRKLPIHPLFRKGYLSIGCSPTTRPVSNLEDRRSGRWSGTDKTECGLHL